MAAHDRFLGGKPTFLPCQPPAAPLPTPHTVPCALHTTRCGHALQAVQHGACPALTALIASKQPTVASSAMRAAAAIARRNAACQDAFAAVGALQRCVRLLESPQPAQVTAACQLLGALVAGNSQQQQAAAGGQLRALDQLGRLLQDKRKAVVLAAAGAAASLMAGCHDVQAGAASAGVLPALALLLLATAEEVRARAAHALAAAARRCVPASRHLIGGGVLPLLVRQVGAAARQPEAAVAAMAALAAIAGSCKAHQILAIQAGGLAALTDALSEQQAATVQRQAAAALGEIGGVPCLLKLLGRRQQPHVVRQAARQLAALALDGEQEALQRVAAAGGVGVLAGVLKVQRSPAVLEDVLTVLAAVVRVPGCREGVRDAAGAELAALHQHPHAQVAALADLIASLTI